MPDQGQTIPVMDPTGQLGDIPREQLNDALGQGYKVAQPADIKANENEQQYGTPGEMAKTFGEGAANAATFGGFRALEKGLNVSPRGIIGREETNPGTYGAGEMAGLVGSSALGVGEGAALESAGNLGARALNLGEQGIINKVGTGAVKGIIENGLFQSGDEVSKMVVSDPSQSTGSAMANVGLSAIIGGGIGGALGAVSPLWEATTGGRLKSYLDLVKNRADGEALPMDATVKGAINQAIQSGMDISPEIQASMSNSPEIQALHAQLLDSSTKPGINLKEARDQFFKGVEDHALSTVGATPEYLESIKNKSDNQLASDISSNIVDSLKTRIKPVSDAYEAFESKAGNVPIAQEQTVLSDKLGQWAIENRLHGRENAGEELYNYAMKRLPNIKDVTDLKNLQQDIWGKVYSGGIPAPDALKYGGDLVRMIRTAQEDTVMRGLGDKFGPEALGEFNAARANYSQMMQETVDPLAARLNVGRYSGAKGFLAKLEEKFSENPEKILNKLNPKDDANLITLLQKDLPDVAQKIRQYHSDEVLSKAAKGAAPGEIKTKKIYDQIQGMSPEMRDWLYTPEQQKTLTALETMRKQLTGIDHNFSGTAKASDAMKKHGMAGALGIASMLMGHSAIAGAMIGEAGRYLTRDLPDAMKLGFLKFLGSDAETNPRGFAAMTNYLSQVYKGEAKTSKAVKSIFQSGKIVIPSREFTDKDVEKIDKRLKKLQDDPQDLFESGKDVAHYLPDHGGAIAQTASNAVNYLNSLRPKTDKASPFDLQMKPDPLAQANYERAIEIAENPLVIVSDVKDGSILPKDIQHLRTLYPGLYQSLSNKMTEEISNMDHDEERVDYRTRMGLSAFLGTTLDSSLSQPSIAAAQSVFMQQNQQKQAAAAPKKNTAKLDKVSKSYQTSDQATQARQLS